MRIHTRTVLDLSTGEVISDQWFEYSGPLAKADRSINAAATNNSNTAGSTAGTYGSTAAGIGGPLVAQLQREAANPIGYTPQQVNNQIVAGEQGAGGATAGITGEAGLNAMRTRNTSALSGVLDQAARIKNQQLSSNALNVQNRSADVGLQNQARAQSALQGLYGTNVNAQLGAMGIQNQDLNTALNADKTGWLQDTEGAIGTLGNLGLGAAKAAGFG